MSAQNLNVPCCAWSGSGRVIRFTQSVASPQSRMMNRWVSFQMVKLCETTQAVYRPARLVRRICAYMHIYSSRLSGRLPLSPHVLVTPRTLSQRKNTLIQLFSTMYDRFIKSLSNNQSSPEPNSPIYIWSAALQNATKERAVLFVSISTRVLRNIDPR